MVRLFIKMSLFNNSLLENIHCKHRAEKNPDIIGETRVNDKCGITQID